MSEQKQGISTGAGIVIAGVLIAGAILFAGGFISGDDSGEQQQVGAVNTEIKDTDHIYGDPDAEITFIEYSDFECPFCGRFHPTMEELVENNPNVRWVYRHFPLSSHANARLAALASECIADLGSEELFWDFGNHVFENQRGLNTDLYVDFATANGIDGAEFITCLDEERFAEKVDGDFMAGQLSGVRGTPHSILVTPDGEAVPFSGALQLESLQTLVDQVNAS